MLRAVIAGVVALGLSIHVPPARAVHMDTPSVYGFAPEPPKVTERANKDASWIDDQRTLLYPSRLQGKKQPITVLLHGMWSEPHWECPHVARSLTESSWLVCPRGPTPAEGGRVWLPGHTHLVEVSVERAIAAHPDEIDAQAPRVLAGFSMGAIAAVELAQRGPRDGGVEPAKGGYETLILMAAEVRPDARLLQKAGIKRVIMASGDRDMMRGHMMNEVEKLKRAGMPAVFLSTGDYGHGYTPRMNEMLEKALAFATSPSSPA